MIPERENNTPYEQLNMSTKPDLFLFFFFAHLDQIELFFELCYETSLTAPSEICGLLKALSALCSWVSLSCGDGSLVPIPVGNKHVESRIIQFRYANLLCILEL